MAILPSRKTAYSFKSSKLEGVIHLTKYELHIIAVITRLLGFQKVVQFLLQLPLLVLTKENQTVFDALGRCTIKSDNMTMVFQYVNPRFLDEIVTKHCYDQHSFSKIEKDSIVIDAGANIGTFTVYSAMRAIDGKIISIEPENRNFHRLKANVEANGFTNVRLVHAALSDINGTTHLKVCRTGSGTIIMQFDGEVQVQNCKTITIHDLLKTYSIQRINLLKLDIEGAEFLVFKDATWLDYVDTIVMEIHSRFGDPDVIFNILKDHNFEVQSAPGYDYDSIYLFAKRLRVL